MTGKPVRLRPATLGDVGAIAGIWQEGWPHGHLGHVPDELVALRDDAYFLSGAAAHQPDATVAIVDGEPAGFVMVRDDEVLQLYVAVPHRGAGVAAALLEHAEERIRGDGHQAGWLAVVAGNARARRFYERMGWQDDGPIDYPAPSARGPVSVPARRYVRSL